MSTNVNTNVNASGATNVAVATETVNGEQVQRIKIMTGISGSDDGDVSAASPFPIELASAASADYQPEYSRKDAGGSAPATDPSGNLIARAHGAR